MLQMCWEGDRSNLDLTFPDLNLREASCPSEDRHAFQLSVTHQRIRSIAIVEHLGPT